MKRLLSIFIVLSSLLSADKAMADGNPREVKLTVIETTDVHGNFFPYNFITRTDWP